MTLLFFIIGGDNMQKMKHFKILFKYFKEDRLKIVLYIILVLTTYLPALLAAFFWGKAVEYLLIKNFIGFVKYK